jgi:hypothetical protein
MEDCLGGEDGFDKGSSTGLIDVFAIPSDKFAGHFVLKRLEVHSFEFPNRKWKPQIFDRKRSTNDRKPSKHVVKVNIMQLIGMTELFWKFVCRPVASPKESRMAERFLMSSLKGSIKTAASSA